MTLRSSVGPKPALFLLMSFAGLASVLLGHEPRFPSGQLASRDTAPDYPQVVKAKATLQDFAEALRTISREERNSYHRLLWRAYHLTENSVKGLLWLDVAETLERQGLKPTRAWDPRETYGQVEYGVPRAGFTATGGHEHDLYVTFSISKEVSETTPTRDRVRWTGVGLRAKSASPLAQVIQQQRYPKGSALDIALQFAPLTTAAKRLPILSQIELEYGYLGNHHLEFNPSGFTASFTLVGDAKKQDAGQSLTLYSASGLDPMRDHAGKAETPEFKARDTLTEWWEGGGSSWGESQELPYLLLRRLDRPVRDHAREASEKQFAIVYSPADVKALPATTRAVVVKDHALSRATILALRELPALEALDIEWDRLDAETVKEVASLPALTRLSLSASGGGPISRCLTDEGLKHICKITHLTELSIRDGSGLTDTGCQALSALKDLTRLSLGSCEHLTDAALAPISELPHLKDLDLWGCTQISDRGLEHLGKLTRLERFGLSHGASITAAGCAHLAKLTELRELTLAWSPIDDNGLAAVGKLQNLQEVSLSGLKMTDTGLMHLAHLKKLQEVWLNDLDITDAGLRHLHELPDVRRLVIQSCKRLSDAGLASLHSRLPGRFERN